MKKIFALLALFILTSAMIVKNDNWEPAPGAKVSFTIDGLFGKDVKGTISDLKTHIDFYPDDLPRSSITATVSVSTINTKNKKRDNHLKNADFFDAEKFPTIRFTSKSFRQLGEYFIVEGDLSLKDVTKPVTIPFEFFLKGDSAVFSGDFNINRLDYNLGKKSRLMGNEVRIHLDIPVHEK